MHLHACRETLDAGDTFRTVRALRRAGRPGHSSRCYQNGETMDNALRVASAAKVNGFSKMSLFATGP